MSERLLERASTPRRRARRRPAGERHQHAHRAPGHRQDDPRPAVPVRERDARAPGALPRPRCPSRSRRSSATGRASLLRPGGRRARRLLRRPRPVAQRAAASTRSSRAASTSCSRSAGRASSSSTASRRSRPMRDAAGVPPLPARPRRPTSRAFPARLVLDRRVRRRRDRRCARVRGRRRDHRALHRRERRRAREPRRSTSSSCAGAASSSGAARLPDHLGERDRRLPAARRPDRHRRATRSSGVRHLLRHRRPRRACSATATGPAPRPSSPARRAAGKTLMGLHFIFNGAAPGEPGVIATLQENPVQLERILERASAGRLTRSAPSSCMYRSPVDLYIDEWVYDLLDAVERTGARRVVIDSLGDLQFASPRPDPLPRVHLLARAAPVRAGRQPLHDLGAARPVPHRPASPSSASPTSPTTSCCSSTSATAPPSGAPSRCSRPARATTNPRSASSRSRPRASCWDSRSPRRSALTACNPPNSARCAGRNPPGAAEHCHGRTARRTSTSWRTSSGELSPMNSVADQTSPFGSANDAE